jgi:hypothetical protein
VPDLSPDEVAELVRAADVSLLSIEADALVSEVLVLVVVVEPDSSITIKHGWSPANRGSHAEGCSSLPSTCIALVPRMWSTMMMTELLRSAVEALPKRP